MADPSDCLLDTNILLRLSRPQDPAFAAIQSSISDLRVHGTQIFYSLQTVAEFWNVATRPLDRNGYGLSPREANILVQSIEQTMTLLPDDPRTFAAWRSLVLENNVSGAQVHDARLAALMLVHHVEAILTLNPSDFRRYPGLRVIVPALA